MQRRKQEYSDPLLSIGSGNDQSDTAEDSAPIELVSEVMKNYQVKYRLNWDCV